MASGRESEGRSSIPAIGTSKQALTTIYLKKHLQPQCVFNEKN